MWQHQGKEKINLGNFWDTLYLHQVLARGQNLLLVRCLERCIMRRHSGQMLREPETEKSPEDLWTLPSSLIIDLSRSGLSNIRGDHLWKMVCSIWTWRVWPFGPMPRNIIALTVWLPQHEAILNLLHGSDYKIVSMKYLHEGRHGLAGIMIVTYGWLTWIVGRSRAPRSKSTCRWSRCLKARTGLVRPCNRGNCTTVSTSFIGYWASSGSE